MSEDAVAVPEPGTITIVESDNIPTPSNRRKRSRRDVTPAPQPSSMQQNVDDEGEEGEVTPSHGEDNEGDIADVPVHRARFNEMQEDSPSQVQRMLYAKYKRRRENRLVNQAQMAEDSADVKAFLKLPTDEDREAYLQILEYDTSDEQLVQGLGKASTLAMKGGLMYLIDRKNYDLVSLALDAPDVKDAIETVITTVGLEEVKEYKWAKTAAAVGQIGDALVNAFLRAYHTISKVAEQRDREQSVYQNRSAGIQSPFHHDGKQTQASGIVPTAPPAQENAQTVVATLPE